MKKISINDLSRIKNKLKGYRLTYNQEGIVKFISGNDIKEYELDDYITINEKLYMPNYDNCILNVDASLCKYYGIDAKYKTFSELDSVLESKKYKHIAIMLLDGLGSYILRNNLLDNSFLRNHKVCDFNALFPPTTACCVPGLCSGIEPVETGWVGWSNYFTEVGKYVVLFRNEEYFSGEKLDIDILGDILPYKNFYQDFSTHVFELGPAFTPSKCETFKQMCDKYIAEVNKHESSFCYMYWGEPDTTMHITGAYSKDSKKVIKDIDDTLREFEKQLPLDTLIIITADHGHIDCKPIYLANFKDILSLLTRLPSNEGRCAFFEVKPFKRGEFVKLFNSYFGDYFTLISKNDFIEEGYLGNNINNVNYKLDSFIGDFVAIGKKNYYFNFDPVISCEALDEMVFKSHHAGITAAEMVIPFILVKK